MQPQRHEANENERIQQRTSNERSASVYGRHASLRVYFTRTFNKYQTHTTTNEKEREKSERRQLQD